MKLLLGLTIILSSSFAVACAQEGALTSHITHTSNKINIVLSNHTNHDICFNTNDIEYIDFKDEAGRSLDRDLALNVKGTYVKIPSNALYKTSLHSKYYILDTASKSIHYTVPISEYDCKILDKKNNEKIMEELKDPDREHFIRNIKLSGTSYLHDI